MAMRTRNESPDCDRTWPTRSTRSRPACTARSASFSWPLGYPNDARASSPTKLITAPPQCVMTEVQICWKCRMMSPKSSGSKLTASAVEPTSPHDSTVNCRLSGSERGAALPWPGVLAGIASPRLDPLKPFRVNAWRGFAIRGALRPYVEFIPDALHREDESRRLRVRLYLAP